MIVEKHVSHILVKLTKGQHMTIEMAEDLSIMNQRKTVVVNHPDYTYILPGKDTAVNPDRIGELLETSSPQGV